MKAKFVNESIKHLKPKTQKEIDAWLEPMEQFKKDIIKYLHDKMLYNNLEVNSMMRKAEKYGNLYRDFEDGFSPQKAANNVLDVWLNEGIKHLKPFSNKQLKDAGYDEKYKNWKPDGYMTLSNWGGIEIKIVDGGEGVEYRFNYGDDNFRPVLEADVEWGIDEDDIDPETDENGDPITEPFFSVGEDKYFLKDFTRSDY